MQIAWLILNTLILIVPAKVGFGFLLLSNHQTLQEAGGGGGAQFPGSARGQTRRVW